MFLPNPLFFFEEMYVTIDEFAEQLYLENFKILKVSFKQLEVLRGLGLVYNFETKVDSDWFKYELLKCVILYLVLYVYKTNQVKIIGTNLHGHDIGFDSI